MELLLIWSTLYLQTPGRSAAAVSHGVSEINSKTSAEFLEEKRSALRIEPEITVSVILGNASELRCRNESREGKPYSHIFCLSILIRMTNITKKC